MELVQSAYNTVGKDQSQLCKATFSRPTRPGNLIIAIVAAAGNDPSDIHIHADGFTKIGERGRSDLQGAVYYRANAPSMTSIEFHSPDDDEDKSLQVRLLEYSGIAQASALDRVNIESSDSDEPHTGFTGTTAKNEELIIAVVINQNASTSQYGWTGGFTRLYETVSPQKHRYTDFDWERTRMSVHQVFATQRGSWSLRGRLSCERDWMAFVATFRGSGGAVDPGNPVTPLRMTSTLPTEPGLSTGGRGNLSVFGPLTSKNNPEGLVTGGSGWIGPFNYQYRLGGKSGLLIGSGTQFHVNGTDGLNGWTVRTSDEDRPRADGAYRGIDLGGARNVVFRLNVGRGRLDVERNMDTLYRALIPQRDTDWELIWRHPTHGLKMMRVRPGDLMRERSNRQLTFSSQDFVLRAADPRHYNAIPTKIQIPVTPGNRLDDPIRTKVYNIGNSPAFPIITITGPENDTPVTKIRLVNETALVNLEIFLVLQRGSTLMADMDARTTGAPRSIITLDSQSKYGAWQLPREPFRIDPDPTGFGGYNELYLTTEPAGAPITCTLEYRDTWYG